MRTNLRLAVASLSGAVIGGLLVYEFALVHWAIGMVVGGLAAYLLCDLRGAWAGSKMAARQVRWFFHQDQKDERRGAINLLMSFLLVWVATEVDHYELLGSLVLTFVVHTLFVSLALFWAGFVMRQFVLDEYPFLRLREMWVEVPKSMIRGLASAIWLLIWQIPKYVLLYFGRLFRFIHTDARMVVAVAAALGVAIGHFVGPSTLLGGLVAIPIALVEYRIVQPWLEKKELPHGAEA